MVKRDENIKLPGKVLRVQRSEHLFGKDTQIAILTKSVPFFYLWSMDSDLNLTLLLKNNLNVKIEDKFIHEGSIFNYIQVEMDDKTVETCLLVCTG